MYHWLKQNKDWNLYVKLHPNESYVFNMYQLYKIMLPGGVQSQNNVTMQTS